VRLADQWGAIESTLPADWEAVQLTVATEQPEELGRAAQVLGPMSVGRVGGRLVVTVRRAGGAAGPEAARRLFKVLDEQRVWCTLSPGPITEAAPGPLVTAKETVAGTWDRELAGLPPDWSDLLCELELESGALLPRAALLCAPINPTRDRSKIAFTFRCARRTGYGVSPTMARRCFERLDDAGIAGRTGVLRVLSDTDGVATQGPVWLVGGRVL
jgi:hypothetical protein